MKILLTLIFTLLLSACGGASSGGAPAVDTGSPTGSAPTSNTHVYTMEVTGQDTDFAFAPVITGTNGNANSPGLQIVLLGQTKTYVLTDTQATVQITGVSDVENNGAFFVTVVVLKDGVQVESWNVGIGVSQNSGLL